jgi:starch synthase
LPQLLDLPWRFVLLGTGDAELELRSTAFAAAHAERVRFLPRFDPRQSRRIYGGADLLLVPSRYEPCGLAQMIAMRYGCLPLVRAVGGLRDTVLPATEDGSGTGFLFQAAEAVALQAALRQVVSVYQQKKRWRQLQEHAMRQDFSWDTSAAAYQSLYQELAERRAQ